MGRPVGRCSSNFVLMACRERQANGKNLRQKEKKLKDLSIQMEDERKQAQQYKDQVEQRKATPPSPSLLTLALLPFCRRKRPT